MSVSTSYSILCFNSSYNIYYIIMHNLNKCRHCCWDRESVISRASQLVVSGFFSNHKLCFYCTYNNTLSKYSTEDKILYFRNNIAVFRSCNTVFSVKMMKISCKFLMNLCKFSADICIWEERLRSAFHSIIFSMQTLPVPEFMDPVFVKTRVLVLFSQKPGL